MKKIFSFIMTFFLLSGGIVFATSHDTTGIIDPIWKKADVDKIVGVELPGPLKIIFANERANVHITLNSGSIEEFYVVTSNGVVQDVAEGTNPNPTIDIYTTEAVIDRIIAADNPLSELKSSLRNNDITHQAATFFGKMKFGLGRFVLRFVGGNNQVQQQSLGEPGDICQHGGECRDGLTCLYYAGEAADRQYRCSCEQFEHNSNC